MAADPDVLGAGEPVPGGSSAEEARINRWTTLLLAGLIVGTGCLFFNLMPLVLASLAGARSLSESQVGFVASSVNAGALLGTLASVLWIRRYSWKRATAGSAVATGLCMAGLIVWDGYVPTLVFGLLMGWGQAFMIASPIAMLSDTRAPSRNFAAMVGLQVAMASVLAPVIPSLEGVGSFPAIMGMIAALTLSCGALALGLPDRGLRGVGDSTELAPGTAVSNAPIFLSLGGLLVFYIGLISVWGFAGILGEEWGLSPGEIASAVSISLVAGISGSMVAAYLGERVAPLSAIAAGFLGMGATFALFAWGDGYLLFLLALVAMNGFWNFTLAYQLGLLSSFDVTGRFAILMTASQTAGAILGPAIMGLMLDATEGFGPGLAFASTWLVLAYGFIWKATRWSASHEG